MADLGVMVVGSIKEDKTIAEINKAIQRIENNPDMKKITLKIDMGDKKKLDFKDELKTIGLTFDNAWKQMSTFFKDGITYVNELNKSLTDLSVIYMKSQGDVAKYGEQFHKMGMDMGVATLDIAKTTVEFARQGLSMEEAKQRTQTAMKFAKVSNLDYATSSQILTATVSNMGVDINRAADVFSYLGHATVAGADEFGKALQKIGGTAGSVGVEFEKVSSWVATLTSRTRESAENIGTAMRTILSRIQSLRDGKDTTQLNQLTDALTEVDVKLLDTKGNFRNFGDVMDDLGKKWTSLSAKQQANVTTAITGPAPTTTVVGITPQLGFIKLMEDYKDSVKNYEQSLYSAGKTQQKFDLLHEGTEVKLTKLKNAWSGVWQSAFDSGAISGVVSLLTSLVGVIDSLVKGVGILPLVIGLATTALLLFNKQAGALALGIIPAALGGTGRLSASVKAIALDFRALGVAGTFAVGALQGVKVAFTSLLISTGVGIAIAGVTWAITTLISYISEFIDRTKAAKEINYEHINSLQDQQRELQSLANEYKVLKDAIDSGNASVEQKQRLLAIQTELVEKYGVSITGINNEGKAYSDSIELIDARAKALQKEIDAAQNLNKIKLSAKDKENSKIIKTSSEEIAGYQKELDAKNKEREAVANSGKQVYGIGYGRKTKDQKLESISVDIALLNQEIMESNATLQVSLKERTDILKYYSDQYIKELQAGGNTISVQQKIFMEEIIPSVSKDGKNIDEQISKVKSLIDVLSTAGFNNLFEQFKDAKSSGDTDIMEKTRNSVNGLLDSMTKGIPNADLFKAKIMDGMFSVKEGIDKTGFSAENLQKKLVNAYENTSAAVRPLNDAIEKMQEGQSLSSSEVTGLLKKYPDLINSYTSENGMLKINTIALEKKRDAEINGIDSTIKAEEEKLKAQRAILASRLTMYSIDVSAIRTTADAKAAELKLWQEAQQKFNEGGIQGPVLLPKDISDALDAIGAAQEAIDALKADDREGFKNKPKNNPGKGNEPTQANLHTLPDFTKENIDNINKVTKARDANIKSLEKQIQLSNKAEEYYQTMLLTNKLLVEQYDKIDDINSANSKLSASSEQVRTFNEEYKKFGDLSAAFDGEKMVGFDQWFNNDASASNAYTEALTKIREDIIAIEGDGKNLSKKKQDEIKDLEAQEKLYATIFAQIQSFKRAWIENNSEIEKINDTIEGLNENLSAATFNSSKKLIEKEKIELELARKSKVEIAQEEYDGWLRVLANKKLQQAQQAEAEKMLSQAKNNLDEANFEHSKNWIENEIQLNKRSLELQLEDWKRVESQYQKGSKQRIEAEKEISRVTQELSKKKEDNAKEIAKQAVELQKKIFEAQRDVELDALKKVAEAEEKRHKQKMDNYDNEMKKFEASINLIQQSIDRESDTADYNDNLTKSQKEADDIRVKIKELALDDSIESKAKQVDLQKELADKIQEIDKLQKDRTKSLRKEGLADLLEAKQKEIDAARKTEDDTYEANKATNDLIKENADNKWKGIIENDQTYLDIERNIMEGHLDQVLKNFETFSGGIAGLAKVMGAEIDKNLNQQFTRFNEDANAFLKDPTADLPSAKKNNPAPNNSVLSPLEQMKKNSKEWNETSDLNRKKELENANETIGYSLGATYNSATGTWYDKDNNPLYYHDGGEVGVSGTSQQGWMSKLLSSNEIPAILKKSEIVLSDPLKFLSELGRNALSNVSNLLNSQASAAEASSSIGSINMYVSVNGDKAGGQAVFNTFVKELEKRGTR